MVPLHSIVDSLCVFMPVKTMLEFSTGLTSGLLGMNKYYGSGFANPGRGSALFVGSHHVYVARDDLCSS